MRILVGRADQIGRWAADLIGDRIQSKPDTVLGLATGSSPLSIYDNLAAQVAAGRLNFSRVRGFALDEYVGLPADHVASYRHALDKAFASRVGLPRRAIQVPDGSADDLDAEAARFDAAIAEAGGVDLQILGIGSNGHIAFNEPGSSFTSRTRVARLSESTRVSNSRFFTGGLAEVPRLCLTQGIGTIMEARSIVLVATGEGKAAAVRGLLQGPIGPACPATALRLHPNVSVFVDDAAVSAVDDPVVRDSFRSQIPQ